MTKVLYEPKEYMVHLLRCLVMILLVYPVIAAPVVTATEAVPATEAVQARRAALEQRVAAWWDALIRQDLSAAYSFTSPGYRKSYSLTAFKGKFDKKSDWRRIEVVDVDFKGDNAATVGINMHFVYHDPQNERDLDMQTYVQEPWVLVDGQWWYLVKD